MTDRGVVSAGVIALTALCLVAVIHKLPSLEDGVTDRARSALDEAGVPYERIEADGRSARVVLYRGSPVSDSTVAEALDVGYLRPVRTFSVVRGEIAAPPLPTTTTTNAPTTTTQAPIDRVKNPELTIELAGGRVVRLVGRVGSPDDTAALTDVIGPPNAWNLSEDPATLELHDGVLEAISRTSPLLVAGQVELVDGVLTVRGLVATESDLRSLQRLLDSVAGDFDVTYDLSRDTSSVEDAIVQATELEGITFGSGTAVISLSSRLVLDQLAAIINEDTNLLITITGHTDSNGVPEQNLSLSLQRADAVAAYLTVVGVNPDILSTAGHGDTSPIADNETREGRAANRRIEFTVARRGVTSQ